MTGKICGTGAYIPEKILDNEALSKLVDTSDEWIRSRTGIRRRHIAGEKETVAFMAGEAAKAALQNAKLNGSAVELILAATMSAEEAMPGVAARVQQTIGAKGAASFDINSACTGFLAALNTAQTYIEAGIYKTVLVVGAEKLSSLVDWNDRNSCILFGDGAGAVVLKADPEGLYVQVSHSEGEKGQALTAPKNGFLQMDGRAVFEFAVSRVPEVIREVLKKAGIEKEEVDMDENWIYVESCIKRKRHVSFRELLGAGHTKMQMVITFLVILELMKMGKISIVQEHTFDDILIDWREDADDTPGRTFESDFT